MFGCADSGGWKCLQKLESLRPRDLPFCPAASCCWAGLGAPLAAPAAAAGGASARPERCRGMRRPAHPAGP